MVEYINKSALVAEIEKIKYETNYEPFTDEVVGKICVCRRLLSFINTLEVKDVDLDGEFDKYCENLYLIDLENEPYAELFECAKHFFELGMAVSNKTQKRE